MGLDFQVISFGRVGTMALNRFLMAHQQIGIHHYDTVVKAFNNTEGGAVRLNWSDDASILTRGITFHDQGLFKPERINTLNLILGIKTPKLIHSIRHPLETLISWMNYANTTAIINPKSGWKASGKSIKSFLDKHPEILTTLKFGYQAKTFYRNAESVFLFDFEQFKEEKVNSAMKRIFDFLEVPPMNSSIFYEPQNDLSLQLHDKGFTVNINGHAIRFSLKASESINIANTVNTDPVPRIGTYSRHSMDQVYNLCPSIKPIKDDIGVVVADAEAYNNLDDNTRELILSQASNIFQQSLPKWAMWAEDTINRVNDVKITRLSRNELKYFRELLKDDLNLFSKYHPEYKDKWEF